MDIEYNKYWEYDEKQKESVADFISASLENEIEDTIVSLQVENRGLRECLSGLIEILASNGILCAKNVVTLSSEGGIDNPRLIDTCS